MQKLSTLEKREVVAGFSRSSTRSSTYKKGTATTKGKFKWNTHNASLLVLSSIPGLITLGEGIWSLFSKKQENSYSDSRRWYKRKSYGFDSYADNKRDFFAYASEAIRPVIRFAPYPSKTGVTFAMPWFL